jgi:HD superfamily phosphodiesterase
VAELLNEGEQELWARMSGPDRRHAVGVARRVGGNEPAVTLAALLHDVGKVDSDLSTLARVPATLAGLVDRDRATRGAGRISRYLRHDAIGADLLAAAGSDPLVVAWAREHHLPPDRWTVDPATGHALKAADDD